VKDEPCHENELVKVTFGFKTFNLMLLKVFVHLKNSFCFQTRLKEPSLSMFAIRQLRESRRAQSILDISLNKLFQSMSIAYRQKLTSPKWNRFRGLKLRWKDKIRFLTFTFLKCKFNLKPQHYCLYLKNYKF
jgi:hypothetical protein